VGNIERPAHGYAEAVLVVAGLTFRLAVQRIRFGVERRAAVVKKNGAMRFVHIESTHSAAAASTAHHHDHRPAATAATCETTTASADHLNIGGGSAQRNRPASSALARQLVAQIGHTVLHFARIKHVLFRPALCSGDGYGFVAAFRRQSGVGKASAGQ
jgi:hypothetical protein